MLEKHSFPIAEIYVPAKRAKTLEQAKVEALAEDIEVLESTEEDN